MSSKLIGALACVLLMMPFAAKADVITGSFTGVMSNGLDTTGVFGTPGADLTNDTITGTFQYDTSLLSQSISDGQNTATGTGLGALTVTVTIDGFSYTFTDPTSSSIFLDDGTTSGESELTLQSTNNAGGLDDSFYLDVSDPITPFVLGGTSLTQSLNISNPFSSIGSSTIQDPGANAGGGFSITSLTSQEVPEPASIAVLAVGLLGMAGVRRRWR